MITPVVFHVERHNRSVVAFAATSSIRRSRCFTWNPSSSTLPCCDWLQLFLPLIVPRGTYQPRVFNQWPITKGDLFTTEVVWDEPPKTFHVERTPPDSRPDLSENDPGSVRVSLDGRVPRGTYADNARLFLSVRGPVEARSPFSQITCSKKAECPKLDGQMVRQIDQEKGSLNCPAKCWKSLSFRSLRRHSQLFLVPTSKYRRKE